MNGCKLTELGHTLNAAGTYVGVVATSGPYGPATLDSPWVANCPT